MKNSPRLLRATLPLLAGALALLLTNRAEAGPKRTEILDRQGNLYQLRATSFADARPGDETLPGSTPVLLLDVSPVAGDCTRTIVPRSLGWEADTDARLFLDGESGTLFVVWVIKGWGTDEIHVSSLRSGLWTADLRISDDEWAGRQGLDASLNRFFLSPVDGTGGLPVMKPVLEVVWWESFPWGGGAPRYVPLFLDSTGTIDAASAVVYDPSAGDSGPGGCLDPLPEAALYPTVSRESIDSSRVTVFSPWSCSFLVLSVRFYVDPASADDGRQARHMPFIGVKFGIANDSAMPMAANSSRLSVVISGPGAYQAAMSWTDDTGFHYQIWTPSNPVSRWSDVRRIVLSPDVTVEEARALVDTLLAGNH